VSHSAIALDLPVPTETPLLKCGSIWVKPEQRQRSGSVKYRMVYAKVMKALREGAITPRTRLVEVTSGSTGVALAVAGKALGLTVELHAYQSMSGDKRSRIVDAGADLVVHPLTISVGELLALVNRRVREGGYWHLGQFERESTAAAYADLAKELVGQLRGVNARPQAFVCPVGTGGLIQGLVRPLRTAFPGLQVVAVEPEAGQAIEGTRNTELCRLENDPYDPRTPDETVRVLRPSRRWSMEGVAMGESASAAFELACSRAWTSTVIVAPD
jgi:cysteine synthase